MENQRHAPLDGHEEEQIRVLQQRVAQLEAELRDRRRENEDLRQRQGAWIKIISHDLRGPLTLILGYAENILSHQNREADTERTRAELDAIAGAARRLNKMITQVVDGARAECGCQIIQSRELNLAISVADEVRKWRRQYPGRTLRVRIPETLPPVQADPRRVGQIVAALLSNAAIFSSPGGTIWVRAGEVAPSVVLTITDQGVGASPEELGQVFERFYRSGRLRTYPREGLGLSLVNARDAARRMGGDLWLESPGEGQGATFSLRLPAIRSADQ